MSSWSACPTPSASDWTHTEAVFIGDNEARSNLSRVSKEMAKSMAVGSVVIQREEGGRARVDGVDRLDIAAPPPATEAGQQDGPDVHLSEHRGPEHRTTGSEGQSCRRCAEPIKGRRRNGFCSDRCRMRDRRARECARVDQLLRRIEHDLAALREELVGEVDS